MDKFSLLMIALLLLGSVGFLLYFDYNSPEIKPKAQVMYSNPIGPTQKEPYILESRLIEEDR